MKPERWQQIEQLYDRALEMEESRRASFLREACAGDDDLRIELEQLLAEGRPADSFMEQPALREIAHEFAATAGSSWLGRQIGNYQFVSLLGAGGMGEVYRARDSRLKREVAIKILPDEFSRDADRISRFQREAEVLASLNHTNIATIYDLQEANGSRFLILELVEGETLSARIAKGPLGVDEALAIAKQICEALEAAHEKGIVHRDLKPANIKLTRAGKVKVLDFGLAKAFAGEAANVNLSNSPTQLTGSLPGTILGTAAYMSPEQANGAALDGRTDIFAFGAVLFEMLTGQRAFPGETAGDILAAVIRAEPDWSRLPANTPAAIRRLLRRCLQKERNRRLQTAGDARIEIDERQSEPQMDTPIAPRPQRNRERMAWIVSLAFAVAMTGFAVPYFRAPAVSTEMRLEIRAPATSDPGAFAISPDGRRLVFVASEEVAPRLWLRSLDATTAQPLTGTEGASRPFWSPDSRSVAFFAANKLKRIDISGGLPQILADATNGNGGTWGPEGVILFAAAPGRSGLFRLPASGGEAVALTKLDAPRQTTHLFPHFLPGGRRFLFFAEGLPESRGIYLGSLDSMETQRLTAADTAGAYLPPGWLLFVRQGTLVAQRFDFVRGELTGDPLTVADPVEFDGGLNVGSFSVSAAGLLAYRTWGVRQLTWFDRSGKPLGTLGAPDKNNLATVELSPDGTRVATIRSVESNTDIFILDAVRLTRFTFDASTDWFPIWSPDGSRIVFASMRKGQYDLYEKASNSAGSETLFVEGPGGIGPNDWSTDGRFFLFGGRGPRGPRLWVQPLEEKASGKPFVFLESTADVRWGQFSPDGRWVAYQSNESGRYDIYVRPFPGPGGRWQVSTSGGIQARWRLDGKELYYIAPDGTLMAVPIGVQGPSLNPGAPLPLFQTRIWGRGTGVLYKQQYDVAPDGRFLINVTTEDATNTPITLLLNWKPPGSAAK